MMTHAHAQSILQAAQDGRPVVDHEWAALQRHLESCADCRAYAEALEGLERGLSRRFKQDLSLRWAAAQPHDLSRGVIERLRGEAVQRRVAGIASAVGVLALLVGLIIGGGLLAPKPTREATTTPAATSTPTLPPKLEDFHGGVAYESIRDGNHEIYLANTGSGTHNGADNVTPDNLTNNPANDTAPAWSPDGEWLAFLSDRTGKNEVYAMHVAGSRLTQLTDSPDIEWLAPLSWSHDGKMVAIVGAKKLLPLPDGTRGQQRAVYLIPTVRAGLPGGQTPGQPTRLGYTGGASWARFSPTLPLIAYVSQSDGLSVYNVEQLGYAPVTWFETAKEGMRTAVNGAFDWSADGKALVYLSEDKDTAWVRGTTEIGTDWGVLYDSSSNLYTGVLQRPGSVRAVSYGPEKNVAVYTQEREPGDGCWRLTISRLYDSTDRVSYDGLCVTSGLARANWTAGLEDQLMGSWLVVAGHRPGESEESLWATALPGRSGGGLILYRLSSAAGLAGTPTLRPTLPGGERLAIDPPPAEAPAASLPPVEIPSDLPGKLVMAPWLNNTTGGITIMRPDGSGRAVVGAAAGRDATCPSLAPLGGRIAFLSDRNSPDKGVDEVFVMNADGSNVRQVTEPVYKVQKPSSPYDAKPLPRYTCPLWSPDGKLLSALVESGKLADVVLIPSEGRLDTDRIQRMPIHQYRSDSPIWTPDSKSVLQYFWREGSDNPWISAISMGGVSAWNPQKLIEGIKAAVPINMAFSPDGKTFAYLMLNIPDGERSRMEIFLFDYARESSGVIHMENPRTVYTHSGYDVHSYIDGKLGWLADGRVFFALVNPTNAHTKVKFMALDPTTQQAVTIWQTDEVVYGTVLSPDGQWLAYDTESGLYMLNIFSAEAGQAGPRRIGPDVMLNMDWK